MKDLTFRGHQVKAAKARWAKLDKKSRSEAMKRVRNRLSTTEAMDIVDKPVRQE